MQKQKLTREQKEKMLLTFLHQDYKQNTEQYKGDLDLFSKECARYFALKGNKEKPEYGLYRMKKWALIQTKEFGGQGKHVLRSEYEQFKALYS